MLGAHRRGFAAVALVFAGCVLPDYEKVDEPSGSRRGAPRPSNPPASRAARASLARHPAVLECTCASDSFCCEEGWDATCAAAIEELGCGACSGDLPDPESEELPLAELRRRWRLQRRRALLRRRPMRAVRRGRGLRVRLPRDAGLHPGACGECHDDADCQALYGEEAPICDAGLCAGCATDADCPDGDTCSDGYCQ